MFPLLTLNEQSIDLIKINKVKKGKLTPSTPLSAVEKKSIG
jgi:hypothetical protein